MGAAVPWAAAGAGAVATQALANVTYGSAGLARLRSGARAADVVRSLTAADGDRQHRQVGIVDASGTAETFTGAQCFDWAGGVKGEGYCCQGNILVGPQVVARMSEVFEAAEGSLAQRLVEAVRAGDDAGGDRRGRQSAAVVVVQANGGYGGVNDRAVDLRVDDHPQPIPELTRLLSLHELYFPRSSDLDFIDVDDHLASRIRELLAAAGHDAGAGGQGYDERLKHALFEFVGTENLEERWTDEARIERGVLDYLGGRRPGA